MPSQATELLRTDLVNTDKSAGKDAPEREPITKQMESNQEEQYQEMPKVDVRIVRDKKIPPGTTKEILVQANIGHKGIGLIMQVPGGNLHCIHSMAINVIAEGPLGESEDKPMTVEQRKKNEKGRRLGIYVVFNSSHDTIVLRKNKLVQKRQLILQSNKEVYHQELPAV